ncbi:cytochrome c oxidase assembly protein COX20, mitochondrial-like [Physella acuta]|uniref:cytochrome c oxidase assembly protein COX20, mitochondrial-like n=1 Tax=Physella acuta TaxID=109671 RepID=UPI0027DAC669|nr:cytochrome c oxidase assembly protein COX20, mitochondrial-like [Physella acuta]
MSTDEEDSKTFSISRITSIPCFRKSFLYGIGGGLGIGLAHFLFTSNVSRATNFGLGGYLLVWLGTWGVCRYHNAQQRFKARQAQKMMKGNQNYKLIDPKDI